MIRAKSIILLGLLAVFIQGCASGGAPSLDIVSSKSPAMVAPPATATPVSPEDPEVKNRDVVTIEEPVPYNVIAKNPDLAQKELRRQSATAGSISDLTIQGSISGALVGGAASSLNTKESVFDVVRILWGTDRKVEMEQIGRPQPPPETTSSTTKQLAQPVSSYPRLGAERGDRLLTGYSVVTIPKKAREVGTIPRPREYTFLDVTLYREDENPAKHFTIASLRLLNTAELAILSNDILAKSRRFKDQAFVFVHGYNTTFEDALYRTAQIAHDLGFDGLPAMYSWPSRGSLVDYSYDVNSAVRSQSYFIEFLSTVAKRTRAKRIHIVAHSLGNRPLLEALRAIDQGSDVAMKNKIGQLIFAAPDVDRDLFSEIVGKLKLGTGRTLYASGNDKALILSRQPDGIPRAGDVPATGPLVLKGLDTIDITDASTTALLSANHSNYAERSHILTDLGLLLQKGTRPPHARFPIYKLAQSEAGQYWKYAANR